MPIRSLCVCVYTHTHTHTLFFLREVGEEYAKALLLVIFGTGIGCAEAAAARASRGLLRPEPLVILGRGLSCAEAAAARCDVRLLRDK